MFLHVFESVCGYSTSARQKGKKRQRSEDIDQGPTTSSSTKDWERRAPFDFTGCLAHIDVTYVGSNPRIVTRVIGYGIHNQQCIEAKLKRFPSIPLHPHVREVALRQLRQGARFVGLYLYFV